ncbi:hypothetical protein ACU5JM_18420 [Rhodococcus erythropolis]
MASKAEHIAAAESAVLKAEKEMQSQNGTLASYWSGIAQARAALAAVTS